MAKRVLIIDDESGFCEVVKDILHEVGYEVDAPHHLASAVGIALAGNYDLIILDLRMPGIDGVEIARLFQKKRLLTPILVISGYHTDTVPQQLKSLGIHHVLPKPSDVPQLQHAVASAMA